MVVSAHRLSSLYTINMNAPLQILSTPATAQYAQKVFDELCQFPAFYTQGNARNVPAEVQFRRFADGEMEASLRSSIRGKDVFFFVHAGNSYKESDPANAKLSIYHAVDAIIRSRPNSLVLFEPYCSPGRSDRTMGRNSVGMWIHYKTLMGLGVRYLISYQLHSDKIKTIFDPTQCAVEDIPASLHLMEYITANYIRSLDYYESHVQKNWLFCSVDAGGESFARRFSKTFGAGLIISYKQRNYEKTNTVDSIEILSASDIAGKDVWVVDDMIDTGGSIEALIRKLAQHKVRCINAAVVHPVFSPPALDRLDKLYQQNILNELLVMDTVPHAPDYEKKYPFVRIVSSHKISAQIVVSIYEKKSLTPFFDDFNVKKFLMHLPYRQ